MSHKKQNLETFRILLFEGIYGIYANIRGVLRFITGTTKRKTLLALFLASIFVITYYWFGIYRSNFIISQNEAINLCLNTHKEKTKSFSFIPKKNVISTYNINKEFWSIYITSTNDSIPVEFTIYNEEDNTTQSIIEPSSAGFQSYCVVYQKNQVYSDKNNKLNIKTFILSSLS